jgi:hypothetical protein
MYCGHAQFFQDHVSGEWPAVHSTGQTSIEISDLHLCKVIISSGSVAALGGVCDLGLRRINMLVLWQRLILGP